jgi:PPK2 family polyphosphate:nucleotide phosphotransferase
VFEPISSTYLVPFDGRFEISEAQTLPSQRLRKKAARKVLKEQVALLDGLQRRLAAADKHSVLLIFQALDAAGKDGTIRALTRGIDSAGTRVSSFKTPSAEERDHDFLWRCVRRLPERGCIGVFNRSYYEEVLVVRVHPEFLGGQRIDVPDDLSELWEERYESIRAHEKHLAESGTLILKFWLNVSRDEQARRFLSRIDEPQKRWKFSAGDLEERRRWPDYMTAFEDALRATSRPWAPWYAIPADHKPTMRAEVAGIVVAALEGLGPQYPVLPDEQAAQLPGYAAQLRAELKDGANAPSRHGGEGLVRLSGEEDGGEHPRHPADARE